MNPAFRRVIIPVRGCKENLSRDFICESGAWIKRGRQGGERAPEESAVRRGVRREEWRLWEIITPAVRLHARARVHYTQLRPDFGGKRPRARLRRGATESVEEKNDRVARPMRKCGGVTRTRARYAIRRTPPPVSVELSRAWM